MSAFYYGASFLCAGLAKWKVGRLTQGMRKAREETILEGFQVVLATTLWLAAFLAFYKWIVLEESQGILDRMWMEKGPVDYNNDDDKFIVMLWAFVMGARNCINFLVWRLIVIPKRNKEYALQNELVQAVSEALEIPGLSGPAPETGPVQELNEVLMHELLFFTGLGIRSACRFGSYGTENEHGNGAHNTIAMAASRGGLSRHLLASEEDERVAKIPLVKAKDFEEQKGTEFFTNMEALFRGHATAGQAGSAQTMQARQDREVETQERDQHLSTFKFRTYAPKKFRKLRELFGVDTLGGDGSDSRLHQAMEQYKTGSFTGGASGSFMYYSGDKRFIVKQITESEKDVMLDILDAYLEHMEDSRDSDDKVQSLLLRVVQLNRMQMYSHQVGGCTLMRGRLYFMVFENIFWAPLMEDVRLMQMEPQYEGMGEQDLLDIASRQDLEVYDLKGSWVGRSTAADANGRRGDTQGKTMKDNDLQEPMYLSHDDQEQLSSQIEKDSAFLQRHNIMDYSLLLGVRKGISEVQTSEEAEPEPEQATEDALIYHAAAAHHSQRYYVSLARLGAAVVAHESRV